MNDGFPLVPTSQQLLWHFLFNLVIKVIPYPLPRPEFHGGGRHIGQTILKSPLGLIIPLAWTVDQYLL